MRVPGSALAARRHGHAFGALPRFINGIDSGPAEPLSAEKLPRKWTVSPRRADRTLLILPVRHPGQGHELDGDVGFGGFDGNDFELFVQRIGRRG